MTSTQEEVAIDPSLEEEQYDAAHRAGADDSEDEDDLGFLDDADQDPMQQFMADFDQSHAKVSEFTESSADAQVNDTQDADDELVHFYGGPKDWKPPTQPDDWTPKATKTARGEKDFKDVDNPGNWDQYTFQAVFEKGTQNKPGKYLYHALPAGAQPCPVNEDGKRSIAGWDFEYNGWHQRDVSLPQFRSGATREELFPENRKGSLDKEMLTKLGLTAARMKDDKGKPDALFFYQLLLPICDPKTSGVPNDPRKPFYNEVSRMSNSYAVNDLRLGLTYGHALKLTHNAELLRWDGVLVMDGVRGGSDGAILRRFKNKEDNIAYDGHIAGAMTSTRWLEIKRIYKLCDNGTPASDKNSPLYNPAYKYDMIYDTIVSNVNAISKTADLDLCGDETTYPHEGYGPPESGLVQGINGKPGVSHGGQIVIVSDVHRIRPRAYVHRHKCHPKTFSAQGPNEVKLMLDRLDPLIINASNVNSSGRGIFSGYPHITWDNFFSGEDITAHVGKRGYGMTSTLRRDRVPADIPNKYVNTKKTQAHCKRAKVAKFLQPIVVTKKVDDDILLQLCTFQSTSSCNFLSVNAYDKCGVYVREKERGNRKKGSKRSWCVEMNEPRDLYLRTYGVIDRIDHYITNCNMFYRSWKYWHSAMIRGKAMATVVAYDVYLECAEGNLDPDWKVDKPVSFYEFRERQAVQMLHYNAAQRKYPGDEMFRECTKVPIAERGGRPPLAKSPAVFGLSGSRKRKVAKSEIASKMRPEHLEAASKRLCGDLSHFNWHVYARKTFKANNMRVCAVCKKHSHEYCSICGVALHYTNTQEGLDVPCFNLYHDTCFFGLAEVDRKLTNAKKKDFEIPDEDLILSHGHVMRELHEKVMLKQYTNRTACPDSPNVNNGESNQQQQVGNGVVVDSQSNSSSTSLPQLGNFNATSVDNQNSNNHNTPEVSNGIRVVPGVGQVAEL